MKIAIIVEWENVLYTELTRSQQMLRQVALQAEELKQIAPSDEEQARYFSEVVWPLELLILYDSDVFDRENVQQVVLAELPDVKNTIDPQFIPAAGYRYTDLKQYGFSQTQADLIIFLDSDVIPEKNWLYNIVTSFMNPEVQAVAGYTFIDPVNNYAKIYSLTTLYDLPGERPSFGETGYFFGNNLIFRRHVLEKLPLPSIKGAPRISTTMYVALLNANGIKMYRNTEVITAHPPPLVKNFLRRGFSQGVEDRLQKLHQSREDILVDTEFQRRGYSLQRFIQKGYERLSDMIRYRHRVDLPIWAILPGLLMMSLYYSSFLIGYGLVSLFPRFMQKKMS